MDIEEEVRSMDGEQRIVWAFGEEYLPFYKVVLELYEEKYRIEEEDARG